MFIFWSNSNYLLWCWMNDLQYYLHSNYLCLSHPKLWTSLFIIFLLCTWIFYCPLKTNLAILLMGDFNLTKIYWTYLLPILNHSTANSKFILSCQHTQLTQHVSPPTRHNNFTDFLFSSQNDLVSSTFINAPFSTSDHYTMSFESFSSPISVPEMINSVRPHIPPKLDFSKINSTGMSTSL